MAVEGLVSVALEVPDLAPGVKFYTDAGLEVVQTGPVTRLACPGGLHPAVELVGGAGRKRLHHVHLRCPAEHWDAIAARAIGLGGAVVAAPDGFAGPALWLEDPHGMRLRLSEAQAEPPLPPVVSPFSINQPGRTVRTRRSAILPMSTYRPVTPLRLGHVMVFTPDVDRSIAFFTQVLGMGLADHAQDVVAFMCCRRNSDHHVVAFAKSPGVGFHHASFQVGDPDEVGRAGRALLERTGRGDWGFGRHTIGSNFFHYIQDPWGSWFEYYSDMDFIDDYALWTPTNYEMEDSLANWAPALPGDFVHNYEVDAAA